MSGARGIQPAMAPNTRPGPAQSSAAFAASQAILAGDWDADLVSLAKAIHQRQRDIRAYYRALRGEDPK